MAGAKARQWRCFAVGQTLHQGSICRAQRGQVWRGARVDKKAHTRGCTPCTRAQQWVGKIGAVELIVDAGRAFFEQHLQHVRAVILARDGQRRLVHNRQFAQRKVEPGTRAHE